MPQTIKAQKSLWSLKNTDEQVDSVEAERHGTCGLQMSTTRKRPASDLIVETPAKVKSGKWSDA